MVQGESVAGGSLLQLATQECLDHLVRFRLAVFLRIFQAESSNSSDSCRSGGSSGMLIYAIILWVPGAFTEVQVRSSAVH